MIYVIGVKPYVKVANYYKEVTVEKKGNEFSVKPKNGEGTKIVNPDLKQVIEMSVSDFYNKKNISNKGMSKTLDMDSLE